MDDVTTPDMLWSGWGDPAKAAPLPDSVVSLLEQLLGVQRREASPVELDEIKLAEPALTPDALEALGAVVGAEHVRIDAETRVLHTRGKSTPDLLRIRAGQADDAPDAVVLPGRHDEVVALLAACAARHIAVVPFGGGTSVVGGLEPRRDGYDGVIALDLRRLNRLVAVDPISRTATLEPGLRGPQAEGLLGERGFTLGHFPQSFMYATVGGFAAARSSGQASAGYGRFDEMVVGLTVATPVGTLELGRAPMSAAGPDLRQLILGSEGAFGIITSVTVRVHPAPVQKVYEGWRFATFAEAAAALRRLAQDGPLPTMLRLSDEAETLVGLAKPDSVGADLPSDAGCLVVTGYEGRPDDVATRRHGATAVLRDSGGVSLGTQPGENWEHGRYSGPYLRDALLDIGALAETLETATYWSRLPELYDAVRTALTAALTDQGTPPLVLCHISHVYEAGASLYFTVVSAQADDPLAQWRRAKAAACDAILAAGGTISHHHAVGVDHRDWFAQEIGPVGVEILRAVKARLDPHGILNPGILIP
jgi:alkyldihydroxyacetonephosphate synthase